MIFKDIIYSLALSLAGVIMLPWSPCTAPDKFIPITPVRVLVLGTKPDLCVSSLQVGKIERA